MPVFDSPSRASASSLIVDLLKKVFRWLMAGQNGPWCVPKWAIAPCLKRDWYMSIKRSIQLWEDVTLEVNSHNYRRLGPSAGQLGGDWQLSSVIIAKLNYRQLLLLPSIFATFPSHTPAPNDNPQITLLVRIGYRHFRSIPWRVWETGLTFLTIP